MKRRWSKRSSSHLTTEAATDEESSVFKIVNIEYPISGGQSDQQRIGGFLENCHYCKKRIANDSEIFMYGNLRGFCSVECRESQMTAERFPKDPPKTNPKKNAVVFPGQSSSYK